MCLGHWQSMREAAAHRPQHDPLSVSQPLRPQGSIRARPVSDHGPPLLAAAAAYRFCDGGWNYPLFARGLLALHPIPTTTTYSAGRQACQQNIPEVFAGDLTYVVPSDVQVPVPFLSRLRRKSQERASLHPPCQGRPLALSHPPSQTQNRDRRCSPLSTKAPARPQ